MGKCTRVCKLCVSTYVLTVESLTPNVVPNQKEATPNTRVLKKLSSTFTLCEPVEPEESPLEAIELCVMKVCSSSDDESNCYEETSFDDLVFFKPIALSSTFVVENGSANDKVWDVSTGWEYDVADAELREDAVDVEVLDQGDEDSLKSLLISSSLEGEGLSDVEMAVDFFDFETVPFSPVVDFKGDNQESPTEVPISATIRRTRLYSLMSTPNQESAAFDRPALPNESDVAGFSVEWLEGNSQNNSHGYGGSGQTSLLAVSSHAAKTSDSAVFFNEDTSLDQCPALASIDEGHKRRRCSYEASFLT